MHSHRSRSNSVYKCHTFLFTVGRPTYLIIITLIHRRGIRMCNRRVWGHIVSSYDKVCTQGAWVILFSTHQYSHMPSRRANECDIGAELIQHWVMGIRVLALRGKYFASLFRRSVSETPTDQR